MTDNRNIPPGAWPVLRTLGPADTGTNPADSSTKTNFKTMGTINADADNLSAAPSANTHLVAKKGSVPQTVSGTASHRQAKLERNGFQGAPQVNYQYPNSPEASQTFRNVRLMPSAKGNKDFYAKRVEGPSLMPTEWPAGAWHAPNKPANA